MTLIEELIIAIEKYDKQNFKMNNHKHDCKYVDILDEVKIYKFNENLYKFINVIL